LVSCVVASQAQHAPAAQKFGDGRVMFRFILFAD